MKNCGQGPQDYFVTKKTEEETKSVFLHTDLDFWLVSGNGAKINGEFFCAKKQKHKAKALLNFF